MVIFIFFLGIGILFLILSFNSYQKFKKNKNTFLDYAPGQPPHFFFFIFGILFILLSFFKLLHNNG